MKPKVYKPSFDWFPYLAASAFVLGALILTILMIEFMSNTAAKVMP